MSTIFNDYLARCCYGTVSKIIACSLQEIKLFINTSLPAPVLHILLHMRSSNALAVIMVIVYYHNRENELMDTWNP